jgi:hypothetical protein
MNSMSVRTGDTLEKFENFEGSESISSSRMWTLKERKILPYLHAEGWPDWDTNPIRIRIQQVI